MIALFKMHFSYTLEYSFFYNGPRMPNFQNCYLDIKESHGHPSVDLDHLLCYRMLMWG